MTAYQGKSVQHHNKPENLGSRTVYSALECFNFNFSAAAFPLPPTLIIQPYLLLFSSHRQLYFALSRVSFALQHILCLL